MSFVLDENVSSNNKNLRYSVEKTWSKRRREQKTNSSAMSQCSRYTEENLVEEVQDAWRGRKRSKEN